MVVGIRQPVCGPVPRILFEVPDRFIQTNEQRGVAHAAMEQKGGGYNNNGTYSTLKGCPQSWMLGVEGAREPIGAHKWA